MFMRKFLTKSMSVFMALTMLLAQSQALSARPINVGIPSLDESVFTLDLDALDQALSELNELDNFLAQNEGVLYTDLEAAESELISDVSDIAAPLGMAPASDDLLGIPAFWWGCVLGWVGWLLVYILTDQDSDETRKAFTGCLVGTGVWVAFSVVYYLAVGSLYWF